VLNVLPPKTVKYARTKPNWHTLQFFFDSVKLRKTSRTPVSTFGPAGTRVSTFRRLSKTASASRTSRRRPPSRCPRRRRNASLAEIDALQGWGASRSSGTCSTPAPSPQEIRGRPGHVPQNSRSPPPLADISSESFRRLTTVTDSPRMLITHLDESGNARQRGHPLRRLSPEWSRWEVRTPVRSPENHEGTHPFLSSAARSGSGVLDVREVQLPEFTRTCLSSRAMICPPTSRIPETTLRPSAVRVTAGL
jgi:hypothetical protein